MTGGGGIGGGGIGGGVVGAGVGGSFVKYARDFKSLKPFRSKEGFSSTKTLLFPRETKLH